MRSGSFQPLRAPVRARGFTYVMLITAVALAGLAMAAIGPMWAESATREREQELLRVGETYARAIANYYHAVPTERRYPRQLSDLLLDTRLAVARRHLRQLYSDPLDPQRAWGLVRAADGGVAGIYSQDGRRPWRRGEIGTDVLESSPQALRYSDWKFTPRQQ